MNVRRGGLTSWGLRAVLSLASQPLKFRLEMFLEESSLTRKVNVPGKYFSILLCSQEESVLHSKDPAANYSSVY